MSDSPVYYRVYLNRKNLICVVCMQDFDEDSYHNHRFYRDSAGERVKFDDENEARAFVNRLFKRDAIDPDDLTPNHPSFFKDGTDPD